MKTNQINLSAIEELLAQVIKAQQEQGETQQQKVVVTNEPISSITEARLRVERLDNLGIGVKFRTLWNDRTAAALGFSKEHIRYVSGLRAWNRSIEVDPKYQAAAIKTAIELEDQYNVHGIIYRERTITKEQAKEFNMVNVPKLKKVILELGMLGDHKNLK